MSSEDDIAQRFSRVLLAVKEDLNLDLLCNVNVYIWSLPLELVFCEIFLLEVSLFSNYLS